MAGSGVTLYATTAAGNKTVIGTIDWREDVYMPSQINDNLGQIMADIRGMANNIASGWIEIGDGDGTYTATYVSATSFRFDGVDVTPYYVAGSRIGVAATTVSWITGTVISSVFSTHTTLTVAWDSGGLVNEPILSVWLGTGIGDPGAPSVTSVRHDCRLDYESTFVIRLNRYGGMHLTIDNVPQTIPAAGVYLEPTGLAVNTLYYIYAKMQSGVMAIAAATTVPVIDPRNGVMVMTGFADHTLVGMVQTQTASLLWESTAAARKVLSYFNRRAIQAQSAGWGGATTGSTTDVELASGRVSFLTWADDVVAAFASGFVTNTVTSALNSTTLGADGAALHTTQTNTTPIATGSVAVACSVVAALTAGAHAISPFVHVNAGGGSWSGETWVLLRG